MRHLSRSSSLSCGVHAYGGTRSGSHVQQWNSMRLICDGCECAPAKIFCAADEAALCATCDEKVHGCNKLANRHIRLRLAEASAIRQCDICEKAPAYFFCGIDGTSLCSQCDMDVHVGGKRTHERYLLMGQRVELPSSQGEGALVNYPIAEIGAAPGDWCRDQAKLHNNSIQENSNTSAIAVAIGNTTSPVLDLNCKPYPEPSCSGKAREPSNSEAAPSSAELDVEMSKREDDG